jgi:hypothetical protein
MICGTNRIILAETYQDAEKVRQPVLFIWSVRSVWFVWLNQPNQIDQINQTNQINLPCSIGWSSPTN